MPTTILDGETYEQARHRRFTEEAKVIEKMKQDEIIRMAREACAPNQTFNSDEEWVKRFAALVAAHEREKQAEQEPVGVVEGSGEWGIAGVLVAGVPIGTKLYAAPVRTKDLTDDVCDKIIKSTENKVGVSSKGWDCVDPRFIVRAVIAADREKNK